MIFAWRFAGKGRSLISGLLVQAVSLLALMEFADGVLICTSNLRFTFPIRVSPSRSYLCRHHASIACAPWRSRYVKG